MKFIITQFNKLNKPFQTQRVSPTSQLARKDHGMRLYFR